MFLIFKGRLAKAMTGALGLNVIEAGLGFFTATILAQMMGADNYGIYSYAMALAGIMTVVSLLGQDKYSVREISRYFIEAKFYDLKNQALSALAKVVLFSLIISALVSIILNISRVPADKANVLFLSLFVSFFTVLLRLYTAFFQGIQKVVTALYPEKLIKPLCFLFFISMCVLFNGTKISAIWVIAANALATLVALFYLCLLWNRETSYSDKPMLNTIHFLSGWQPALPFALLAGISIVNSSIDILILGLFVSDADIGIYRISARVSALIAFALIAVNSAIGPNISSLFAKKDFVQLQKNVSKAALACLILALPCVILFISAGRWVLSLFGSEFTDGTYVLTILSLGQLGNVLAGSVGLLLMMTNYAKKAANSLFFSLLLNIVLNLVLVPSFGAEGAAIATSVSMILLNLVNIYWVWHYLAINPTVLGFFIKKSSKRAA